MKIHWLITALLLFATGCKPQQPEPPVLKVKPLPDETIGSSTPGGTPTIAPKASSTKAGSRPSPSVSPSPKVSPTPKTSPQKASKTKADTRSSPSVSPTPKTTTSPLEKVSPTPKTITSPSEAVLTATNPKSQINLRSAPSTSSKRLGYGKIGERVQVIEEKTGADGYTWYKVKFPRSGTQGWIRKDFVKATGNQPPSKPLNPSASPASTPSNKPSPKNSKSTP